MATKSLDNLALEHTAKAEFGMNVDVDTIIVHEVAVGSGVRASVFLTKKKQLLCYLHAQGTMTLGDVQKIITRMGLRAELYMPPVHRPNYFDAIATDKFREVFPGRHPVSDNDLVYYRTLAPYNPALVHISEVKSGTIYQYDSDAHGGWRPSVKFAYRRIRTS